jgi:hypothetical protein
MLLISLKNPQVVSQFEEIPDFGSVHETAQFQGADDEYSLTLNHAGEGVEVAQAVWGNTGGTSDTTSEWSTGSMGIEVAVQFGTPPDLALWQLQAASNRWHAELAVQEGANVLTTAQRYGITSPEDIASLEQFAIWGNGAPATAVSRELDGGENISAVAEKHGLTTPGSIMQLVRYTVGSLSPMSAGSAAARGENVQDIAKRYGFTEVPHLGCLEHHAIGDDDGPLNPAGQAVSRGENVLTVASRYGITTPVGNYRLQFLAVNSEEPGAARSALRNGKSLTDTADRIGITSPAALCILGTYDLERRLSPS